MESDLEFKREITSALRLKALMTNGSLSKDVQAAYEQLKLHPLVQGALKRLQHELPADLTYHSYEHTLDVLHDAALYALEDGLAKDQLELVAIAAAFHDLGFIRGRKENEMWASEFARHAMLEYGGYPEEKIQLVERMILDTRLVLTGAGPRQLVTHPLSAYLLDADMSNLGRSDFFEKGEAYRQELGMPKDDFLRLALQILRAHQWHTPAARRLRQDGKVENVKRLQLLLSSQENFEKHKQLASRDAHIDRQVFLAQLPLSLNASLDPQRVLERALDELKARLECEAATVFLREIETNELSFWALSGGANLKLRGLRIPDDKGIVGWVISQRETVLVGDVKTDPRFFSEVDKHAGFVTRNMICAPLMVRGAECIGAVQVLNKVGESPFNQSDVQFLAQVCLYIALAIDNARLCAKLKDRSTELELLDKRRAEAAQIIAHEFRTPLNVVQNCADLINAGIVADARGREQLQLALMNGVNRLNTLIANVRDLTMVEASKFTLHMCDIDLESLVCGIRDIHDSVLRRRKLDFEFEANSAAKTARGDYALISVALNNLISNAIRFTPDGGKLGVRCVSVPGGCKIEIWDRGIGIEREQQKVIFNKFYEVAPANQHSSGHLEFKSSGLGIGLATAKAIIEAHHSRLEVASALGAGATFTFYLGSLPKNEELTH